MSNQLEQLKTMTMVVADTADFEMMRAYLPQDATTNPSLILQACGKEQYAAIIKAAIESAKADGLTGDDLVEEVMDRVLVGFGCEILKIVPGRVSTEVDAALSFDTEKTIAKARKLCELYKKAGIDVSKHVLIKIASTWEGIVAAKALEAEGIHCNLTLLFSFAQATACGEAGVTLISPFVGRILDWHKAKNPTGDFAAEKDPGVISVQRIYKYYKARGFKTIVMGASFRNAEEIRQLAGVDALTISPGLLKELADTVAELPQKLSAETAAKECEEKIDAGEPALTEEAFRAGHAADPMGTDKLEEGIKKFAEDGDKLRALIKTMAA